MYACIMGNLTAATELCESGADVNFVRFSSIRVAGGETA